MAVIQLSNNVVIIGGGVAAISAIKAIREIDSETSIYVFQNERIYPYYRIRLTKGLFDNLEENKILLQKKEWYELNNVNLYLDKEVVTVDTVNHRIIIDDGSSVSYDKLLLANGSYNFTPPIDGINKENVYTIRKFSDIQNIKTNIEDKNTVINIGGGIQGLEAAWALSQQGKEVIIAEVQERLMPRQLDKKASEILKKAIEGFNIKVLLETQIEKITGENQVKGVITKDGNIINCDMVIYSVGIRANKALVENTAIKTNHGVIVNDRMQTNIENVYAAGDVAELEGKIGGLWSIAADQGKTAGYNIAGRDTNYSSSVPVTTINAFNTSLFSMGNINEDSCTEILTEESLDGLSYKRIFLKDYKVVGAIVIGDAKYSPLLKSAIEKEKILADIDLSNISVNDLLSRLKNN
jgi:nitrite reductase (NADH) large subunit